jgi:adenine-specific DNA-methyltransferase
MPELEKVKCSTPDFAKENAKKLLALFPECEGAKGEVDIDKLRQVLSSTAIEGNVERYQFTWPGKRNAMAAASAATTKTLRPCVAESVGRDGTPGGFDSENLYIEGDNLEVLKLLQTSYAGKVKMIYVDPPYNTGHDFVYRDRFSLTQKELESEAGVFDEDGNRFEVNDSAEARYHSNWCSMMYPRLKLARNLLRDDGVIFISIDDNEVIPIKGFRKHFFGKHMTELIDKKDS